MAEALTEGKPWYVYSPAGQIVPVTLALLTPLPAGGHAEAPPPAFRTCAAGTLEEAVCDGTQTQSFHEQLRNSRNSLCFWGFLFCFCCREELICYFRQDYQMACPQHAGFQGRGKQAVCLCVPASLPPPFSWISQATLGVSLIFLPYVLCRSSRLTSLESSALLKLQEKGSRPLRLLVVHLE